MPPIPYTAMPGFTPVSPVKSPRELAIQEAMDVLFHHRHYAPQDVLICLEVNHVYLGNGGFVLTVFRPESGIARDQYLELLNNLELLITRSYEDAGIVYVSQVDAQIVVLSCFPRLTPDQHRDYQIYDLTERYARNIVELCLTHWGIQIYAAVGALGYSVDSISSSFFFLTETMEYKLFRHENQQILYLPEAVQFQQLSQGTDTLQRTAIYFANEIYSHSLANVPERVSQLMRILLPEHTGSMRNFHFCLLVFVQSLANELLKLDVLDNGTLSGLDMLGTLYQVNDIDALRDCLISQITQIQLLYANRCSNRSALLVERAKAYINGNYARTTLSAAEIADTLGVNQSTLSTTFKSHTGTTLIAYIRHCRVTCAKQLLANREYSLNEIAERSGFGSLNTMYRAFRTLEGMSPGKLR